jgi:hypothetical protein
MDAEHVCFRGGKADIDPRWLPISIYEYTPLAKQLRPIRAKQLDQLLEAGGDHGPVLGMPRDESAKPPKSGFGQMRQMLMQKSHAQKLSGSD